MLFITCAETSDISSESPHHVIRLMNTEKLEKGSALYMSFVLCTFQMAVNKMFIIALKRQDIDRALSLIITPGYNVNSTAYNNDCTPLILSTKLGSTVLLIYAHFKNCQYQQHIVIELVIRYTVNKKLYYRHNNTNHQRHHDHSSTKPLNTKAKILTMTDNMIVADKNEGPGLGQAQKCCGFRLVNGTQPPTLKTTNIQTSTDQQSE